MWPNDIPTLLFHFQQVHVSFFDHLMHFVRSFSNSFFQSPGNCIGQKFSQLEQRLVLAKLIRNFYFESVDAEDKLILVGEMILKSKNGLRVKVYRRFNEQERYCSNCLNSRDQLVGDDDEISSRNL